jgi:hypothetical protein
MPWGTVNSVIDTNFNYEPPQQAKHAWTRATGRAWDNLDDESHVKIKCPRCSNYCQIPWTTCGLPEHNTEAW